MIGLICRQTLKLQIYSMKFWLVLIVGQICLGLIFQWLVFEFQQHDATQINVTLTEGVIHPFFAWTLLIFLVIIPFLTAPLLSGERQRYTLHLLLNSPLKASQIILGKHLAVVVMISLLLGIFSIMPFSLLFFSKIDWQHSLMALAGLWLLLTSVSGVGVLISTLCKQTHLASIVTFFCLLILSSLEWGARYGQTWLQDFSIFHHGKPFLAGYFHLSDIVFYFGLLLCTLAISILRLRAEKYYSS